MDDIQEEITISKEAVPYFIYQFIKFGDNALYPRYATVPGIVEELIGCQKEYAAADFLGCIRSSDASHVIMEC